MDCEWEAVEREDQVRHTAQKAALVEAQLGGSAQVRPSVHARPLPGRVRQWPSSALEGAPTERSGQTPSTPAIVKGGSSA